MVLGLERGSGRVSFGGEDVSLGEIRDCHSISEADNGMHVSLIRTFDIGRCRCWSVGIVKEDGGGIVGAASHGR